MGQDVGAISGTLLGWRENFYIRSYMLFEASPHLFLNRAQIAIVGLVVLLHIAIVMMWHSSPVSLPAASHKLSVSLAMQPTIEAQPEAQLVVRSISKPVRSPQATLPVEAAAPEVLSPPILAEAPLAATAPPATSVAATPMDTEPDYTASYLNNPQPVYPMLARRMGWRGKVILNVEVLADGRCGGIRVFQSSGHRILDDTALDSVRNWRFIPARHAGKATSQWFKIPINFSLEG